MKKLALILLLTISCTQLFKMQAHAAERPNIIFLLTDDQRFDALGCMGNKEIHTPNIDKMAGEGIIFDQMFCTTSICAISRASFMLGQYERRHKIAGFGTSYSNEQLEHSFPVQLRKNGYRTCMVGKWGIGGPLPKNQYDVWYGFPGQNRYYPKGQEKTAEHLTQKLTRQALEFIDGCSDEKPFMLQLYTKSPHCQDGNPRQFPSDRKFDSLFAKTHMPVAKNANDESFHALPEKLQISEARERWKVRFANPKMHQGSVKDYYRLIAGIDEMVGEVREKLVEKGFDKNTIIIYTSDNGFYLGEHGLAGKWFMHEESIRLPLIVFDPRHSCEDKKSNRRRDEMVLNIDIAPTIFELAGLTVPGHLQGRSLVTLLEDKKISDWRTDYFYEHRFDRGPKGAPIPQTEGVRDGRWKYCRYYNETPVYEELFDLHRDPLEEFNLAGNSKFAEKLESMRTRCDKLAKKAK